MVRVYGAKRRKPPAIAQGRDGVRRGGSGAAAIPAGHAGGWP